MEKCMHMYLSLLLSFVLNFNSVLEYTLCYAADPYRFSGKTPFLIPSTTSDTIFNVLDYGAQGDGSSYDNEAFQAAWNSTCEADGGVMVVPSGHTFLLQPIIFNADKCQHNVVIQVDGKIVAPSNKSDWKSTDAQWILFEGCMKGLTISGNGGVFDGQGEAWWNPTGDNGYDDESVAPHAMRISNCLNLTVTGITIQNSPRMHIFIEQSLQVEVFNFTVSSPGDSSNTDGIHLSHSQHVYIHDSTLACGDDCISIQTGCSDVIVHDVNCGPGHGYSIGSLGRDGTEALVSDVIVYDSNLQSSMTGVRIKTWEGGSGWVRNVTFSNITMSDVETPIVIDQHYCEGSEDCPSELKAVAITGITYQSITGTYTKTPVSLQCSEQVPCQDLSVAGVQLKLSELAKKDNGPRCSNAYGQVLTQTLPTLDDCVQSSRS